MPQRLLCVVSEFNLNDSPYPLRWSLYSESLTNQSFASHFQFRKGLTIVQRVFPNDESFRVDSIQDENRGNAEQKRGHDDLGLSMIRWICEV